MSEDTSKRKLIQLLERKAWKPVLKASPDDYSDADRKRLERVRKKTESQRERYAGYESAGELLREYKADLHSRNAKKVDADLKKLGLPTQADIQDEFFGLAGRLGVAGEQRARRKHRAHPPHPWHKSKPEDREKAKKELTAQARKGNKAAIRTLKKAPRVWARHLAEDLTGRARKARKGVSRGQISGNRARKSTSSSRVSGPSGSRRRRRA
jgi:hypothetical protein